MDSAGVSPNPSDLKELSLVSGLHGVRTKLDCTFVADSTIPSIDVLSGIEA